MKVEFDGISAKGRMLLAENRFNNSKAFYDENKELLKSLTTVPARQLASAVSEELILTDDKINTIPEKMVSRIRRDTRFSKDKTMYRENMWVMFMRPKNVWEFQPCMWFEFFPTKYTYGVGMFGTTSKYLDKFRNRLTEHPDEFRSALKSAQSVGACVSVEMFKREKYSDVPEDLKQFYNMKYFCMMYTGTDLECLEDERIVDKLKKAIAAYRPMYRFLLEVMNDMVADEE